MQDELERKSLSELREIAQSFGIGDIFEKTTTQLAQEIAIKHKPAPVKQELPKIPNDVRLTDAKPAAIGSPQEIVELLEPYIKRGLKLELHAETWDMHSGVKHDSGSMRMPLKHILMCARKVFS